MLTPRSSISSHEPQLAPGDVLARKYRLLEPLGEGNMATVWVALNMALETRVAVKILRADLAGDPRLVARFRQEAKATAAIAHKNIVQVYDYGVTNAGAPFITMELLEGETLAERLKRVGPLPPVDAVRTLMRAMKGVTVAHTKGVVHRDLKPDNIFLAREDNGTERPKVLDFGVSFVKRTHADERLTKAGGLLGTPAYLAPEMIEGDSHGDVRGDVWAFGVMLYETLSGQMPFRGRTVHVLLDAICTKSPAPLTSLVPDVDPALAAIVERALAKDPDERYPGVRELYDDLEGWLNQVEPARPDPTRRSIADDEDPTLVGPSLESIQSLPAADPEPVSERIPSSSRNGPSSERASSPGRERTSSPGRERTSSPGRERTSSPGRAHESAPPSAVPADTTATSRTIAGRRITIALVAGLVGALGSFVATRPGSTMARSGAGSEVMAGAPGQDATAAPTPTRSVAVPTAPVSVPAVSGAPAQGEATVDVLGLPERALVRIDEHHIDHLPVAIERGRTVWLRVDAPGYEPWLQEVMIEGSVRLRYGGRPLHAPPRGTP